MLVLRIFFPGLIAFVPLPHSSQMAALVVDAVNPDPSLKCTAAHTPKLTFTPASGTCPDGCSHSSDDSHASGDCTCKFKGRKQEALEVIGFQPTASPMPSDPRREPPNSFPDHPQDGVEAGEFSFIFNLSNIGFDVLKTAVSGDPDHLVARMVFPYTRLTACSLALDSDIDTHLHSYNFHPEGSHQRGRSQPVAQGLEVEANISGESVSLVLGKFGSAGPVTIPLAAVPCEEDRKCVDLWLENDREVLPSSDPCDDPGRDFGFFYDLATVAPPWGQRPIPHEERNLPQGHDGGGVHPGVCPMEMTEEQFRAAPHKMKSMATPETYHTHPICAMAMFYPYQ